MKYPLQIELEKDLQESVSLLARTYNYEESDPIKLCKEIARKYSDAIQRINAICVNRNRF